LTNFEVITKLNFGSPQKARDLRQIKAAVRFSPAGILKYFMGLKREANTEIGPKGILVMTSDDLCQLLV
jgi:hypothetical protein